MLIAALAEEALELAGEGVGGGELALAVEAALAELKRAAATEANLMPPIIEAARTQATEGEMIAAMQEVFGTYTESPVF